MARLFVATACLVAIVLSQLCVTNQPSILLHTVRVPWPGLDWLTENREREFRKGIASENFEKELRERISKRNYGEELQKRMGLGEWPWVREASKQQLPHNVP